MISKEIETVLSELIARQEERLYAIASRLIPNITRDDLLQPNDFPLLENHPSFRHEEGVLEGLRSALTAIKTRLATYLP